MLVLTGVVIELALMPIGLFHFHRAGVYGALANVIAIPLTTFASMPLIALALLFDTVGAGAPFWWLAGLSLDLLLWLARWVAGQPGSVTYLPAMTQGCFALFVVGGMWLALWRGRQRLLGLVPVMIGYGVVAMTSPPDLLVSGDGRHVGISGLAESELVVLRESKSDYIRQNLTELAGMNGEVRSVESLPQARCTPEFCALDIERGGRAWHLLMGRGTDWVPKDELAAACAASDIVVADRWLPRSCRPRFLKADKSLLYRTGGLVIDLESKAVTTVASGQGAHGWWQEPAAARPRKVSPRGSNSSSPLPQ